ncbi:DUF2326 domain-containing protein [Flavobacterium aestuarii]|uniref:DUF2326 domain-containing protein n=1 Tax=Flavobacterium aestuarii TaxID=3149227 RepID=UPI0032B34B6F
MKLSKLYSNKENFKNISFNLNGVNVIYADVQTELKDKKNSHDLGKTKVAELIDFLLLKKIDKKDFLLKLLDSNNKSIFNEYIFYLEIGLNDGRFLTVRRGIENNTKIAFSLSEKRSEGFIAPLKFDFENISIDKAKEVLAEFLNLDFFFDKNYDYRKALSYNLRTPPDDYKDVFQLSKFSNGKHKYWKPFIFDLLGFDGDLLLKKYENDDEIEELKGFIGTLKREYKIDKKDRDSLIAEKRSIEENNIEIEKKIDAFNFYEQDKKLIENGISDIENSISEYNSLSYNLNYEIDKLKKSIQNNFAFELNKVEKVFEETGIYFGNQIKKDYQELLDFNSKITVERNKLIKKIVSSKEKELKAINLNLIDLNSKKENLLSVLQDTDTFKKFKTYQKALAKKEEELNEVNSKINYIDLIFTKEDEIEDKKDEIESTIDKLNFLSRHTEQNEKYDDIRKKFHSYYKFIMDESANISWHLNANNNIEFPPPKVLDKANKNTAKDEGTTYKKILCVAFDLAILTSYNNQSFFRFIYHDDVLSTQDNGIKLRLLELINKLAEKYNIQYVLSVIKSDLPVDENDSITYFQENEIILNLNDKNEEGTLFGFSF